MFQGAEKQIVLFSILNINPKGSMGEHLLNKGECEPKYVANNELAAPKINDILLYPKFRNFLSFWSSR